MTNISKSILLTGVILMALLCMIGTAAAEPTPIDDWSDFMTVRQNSGEEYILMANLDFNDVPEDYWIPLGSLDAPFTGTFDGGIYTISNLTLSQDSYDGEAGFFGYIGIGAELKNITLENVTLDIGSEEVYSGDLVGIGLLAGVSVGGMIENCHVDGQINISNGGETYNVGGLVGHDEGDVKGSSADANITITSEGNTQRIGGLIGETFGGMITETNGDGGVTDSYATGNIIIKSEGGTQKIGGLVGASGNDGFVGGTITNSYADTSITITSLEDYEVNFIGGLVGYNRDGDVTGSHATGDITIASEKQIYNTGGLVGCNYGTMENSYATGDVIITSASDEVSAIGGLIGYNEGVLTNNYAAGNITIENAENAVYKIGGFVGDNYGEVTDSYVTGSIKITSESGVYQIGGLVGFYDAVIENCYALNKEIMVNEAIGEIGKAAGGTPEGGEAPGVYAWDGMEGEFNSESDEPEPITSAEVWNKIDWLNGGDGWRLNTYRDFRLPVPMDQEETTEADASHLNSSSSSRGGGSGTGSATVVDPTTNTSNPPSTGEGYGEEVDNNTTETSDGGNDSNDSVNPPEPETNWTVIILVIAAVVVVAIAGGLYLKKTGKLKF